MNDDYKFYLRIIISSCDVLIQIIFIIIGIKRLYKIKNHMNIEKKYLSYSNMDNSQLPKIDKQKWTFFSMIKFIINKIIVLLHFSSIIIYFLNFDLSENLIEGITFTAYCIVNCISWIISTRLFYKEYRIYKDQTYSAIRVFWILMLIFNIIELVYRFFDDALNSFYETNKIIFLLFSLICFFSFILFLLAIFHPYDVSIEKTTQKEDKIKDDLNETRISTGLQDDLLNNNSEDEFTNDEDLSFQSTENIVIELDDAEGFNKKLFIIELKVKTQDFKQLIFSLKIQKVKHKRVKLPSNVSNFNEVILKYYKRRDTSKDVLNLIKQAYNISLTLNPLRTSFTGDKKNSNLLAHLYREIIRKDKNFLLDLIKFLNIKSDDIVQCLSGSFTSIYEENPSVEKEINRIDTLGSIFDSFDDFGLTDISNTDIKKQKTEINKFQKYSKTDKKNKNKINDILEINEDNSNDNSVNSAKIPVKRNIIPKDYVAFSSFYNNILINERYITIQIISYEEISTSINFLLKTKKKEDIVLQLNIDKIHDIIYDDELASYIIDNSEDLNNKQSDSKKIMEELFNTYLNNIIYYDERLYNLFNLNKLLNLDIEKFNNEILQKFFEEKKSHIGLFKNDIRLYLFDIKIKIYKNNEDLKPLINQSKIEIALTKTNIDENIDNKKKKINCKINIIKLYLIIEDMVSVLSKNIMRYNELSATLNNIKIYTGKLLNIIHKIAEDQLKNIKNYRIKEAAYGDNKKNLIVTEFEKKFSNSKIQLDAINQEIMNNINKEIKNIDSSMSLLLNKPNLKYALYFTSFRDLIEFSTLF